MSQTMFPDDVYKPDFPSLGLFSTWFGVILILATAVLQMSQSAATLWAQPVVDGLQFLLIALVLASLLYLTFRSERGVKWAALPLAINMGTLIIVQLVPFSDLWETWRFQWRSSQYAVIVQMIETGELLPEESGLVTLPDSYRYLSVADGRIWVEREGETTAVFFYTERRAAGNFSGYLYRSDNQPPQPGDFGGQWRYVAQRQPNWYFCISES